MSPAPHLSLQRAVTFLFTNARLLERALFARRFRGGPAEAVVAALRAYRNPDGGFGHALEPDVRAPDSMALHGEVALRALQQAGARDPELGEGLAAFLDGIAEPDGRVPIVTPAVRDHPRAAHWDGPPFSGDSPNPTAALAGLLRAQGVRHPWVERAEAWCWKRLETRPLEDVHELFVVLTFLEHAPDRARAQGLAVRLVGGASALALYRGDPQDPRYGLGPLDLCPTPDALARPAFEDALLREHLDALAARQQEDGGWPIAFQPPGPAAVFEWRGRWTLAALETLRAWGRL